MGIPKSAAAETAPAPVLDRTKQHLAGVVLDDLLDHAVEAIMADKENGSEEARNNWADRVKSAGFYK